MNDITQIVDKIKALVAVNKGIKTVQQAPRLSFLDPSHLAMLLTVAGSIYTAVDKLLPPQQALEIGAGLTLLFLLYSFVLKLHGQTAAAIPGISPTFSPEVIDQLLAAVEAKYPKIVALDQVIVDLRAASPKPPAS